MHRLLKRIALHGTITALILALLGLVFAEMAQWWMTVATDRPGSADLHFPMADELRSTMPLRLAVAGFAFIVLAELSLYALGRYKPVKPALSSPPADDAEKLLNELLAQAEARMAENPPAHVPHTAARQPRAE
ncbi:MAG: hypothetical protein RMJ56_05750 [Gemmataceae bacterium]|nr:hypothetical protein [Gemmata sp.]MDW8197092.1 hypothetical protein [Gemmataceae bacterium]